jgi:hypothetical protein
MRSFVFIDSSPLRFFLPAPEPIIGYSSPAREQARVVV